MHLVGGAGEADLGRLLAGLRPLRRPGEFVIVLAEGGAVLGAAEAMIREHEATTAVLERGVADQLGLDYDFVAAWITLEVHSALAAVGLTAAVSTALTEAGISCNMLAGYHHDHLLVPAERVDDALNVLRGLAGRDGSAERDR